MEKKKKKIQVVYTIIFERNQMHNMTTYLKFILRSEYNGHWGLRQVNSAGQMNTWEFFLLKSFTFTKRNL